MKMPLACRNSVIAEGYITRVNRIENIKQHKLEITQELFDKCIYDDTNI